LEVLADFLEVLADFLEVLADFLGGGMSGSSSLSDAS
jgi:hypothetical protein